MLVLSSCFSPELASPEGSASQLDILAAKVQGLETKLAEVRREVTQINSRSDALFNLIRTRNLGRHHRTWPTLDWGFALLLSWLCNTPSRGIFCSLEDTSPAP